MLGVELEELGAGVLELDGRVLELLDGLVVGPVDWDELEDSGAPPQLASPRAANIDKMQTIFFILAFLFRYIFCAELSFPWEFCLDPFAIVLPNN